MKAHFFQTPGTSPDWLRRALVLVSLFVLALAVTPSDAQTIYKWEDEQGILHIQRYPSDPAGETPPDGQPLVKTHQRPPAWAPVSLLSNDRELPSDTLRDYYGLRFPIEFTFRAAKPYGGLEDFMTVTPTALTNAAHLALFMVKVSYRLLRDGRQRDPAARILDLKAHCRGYKYVDETIPLLPEKPEPVLLAQIFNKVAC